MPNFLLPLPTLDNTLPITAFPTVPSGVLPDVWPDALPPVLPDVCVDRHVDLGANARPAAAPVAAAHPPHPAPRHASAQPDAPGAPGPAEGPEGEEGGAEGEPGSPPCVMCFNAVDATGAGGIAGDVATLAAMGAHALVVPTSIWMRDTAEVMDHHPLEADVVDEQARTVLEDVSVSGFKVGFLGEPETVSAVAEILSDYPELPVVTYLPNLGWLPEDQSQPYLEAWRDLILPATSVLVGGHAALQEVLLPDWDSERPPSTRELAVAAGERGVGYVLATGILLPTKGGEQFIDNVLASPQGAISGEKFEMFEAGFVGAGDTLSAALAALLAGGAELQAAVAEALAFMDQALDAGFRPGMGQVIPDRFFWALPPEDEEGAEGSEASPASSPPSPDAARPPGAGRTAAPGKAGPPEPPAEPGEAKPAYKGPPRRIH